MKKTFLLLLLCFQITSSYATHLIGGELTYEYLGHGDWYKIKLTVYRDCYFGIPPFDERASIAVFNANGNALRYLEISTADSATIALPTASPCMVVPNTVCVSRAIYIDSLELPFIAGGYTLTYQRCCRNGSIANILNPTEAGSTYTCFMTEQALLQHNSSPVFNNLANPVICNQTLINFDHSATDRDGDRLVHKLCTPYYGASATAPIPRTLDILPPPYTEIAWQQPYGLNNLLGGAPLAIHPVTGRITGTPNTIGQFVVGVCVDEYRNNVLIGQTKRDFQYNVTSCGSLAVNAAFTTNTTCGNLSVGFNNQTVGGTAYHWDFGVQGVTNDTSALFSPNYTFPDTGCYVISLAVRSNDSCTTIRSEMLCLGYITITQNDNTLTAPLGASYHWYLNGNPISGATQQTYTATQLGIYTVVVIDNAGCPSVSTQFALRILDTQSTKNTANTILSPNPTNDILYIKTAHNAILSNILIYNNLGEAVLSATQTNEISTAHLPPGIYFVRISQDNQYIVLKFIKI